MPATNRLSGIWFANFVFESVGLLFKNHLK